MTAAVEAVVRYKPGQDVTAICDGTIVAGTFVKLAATHTIGENFHIVTCGAGQAAWGVALRDGVATDVITVWPINAGGCISMVTGTGGLTFGQEVESDAAGKPVAFTAGKILGMAGNTATATNPADIFLGR